MMRVLSLRPPWRRFFPAPALLFLCLAVLPGAPEPATPKAPTPEKPLRVAVAGTAPFVGKKAGFPNGIAVEIWRDVAARLEWEDTLIPYESVSEALQALENQEVDAVVGPSSISARRARRVEFSQPYFQSSLSILAPVVDTTLWQRLSPFFTVAFFGALGVLILFLLAVGTLLWLAERRHPKNDFPTGTAAGIATGMWCAVVTMTTVGYGDIAPRTAAGRVIAATWMVISLVAATSLVAGIASALALSNASRTISTAEELHGHTVALLADSPAKAFVERFGARIKPINSLEQGYQLLEKNQADALVFDRPQLLYFLRGHHNPNLKLSTAQYQPQGYGFAFPLNSDLAHQVNVQILQLEESGRVGQIIEMWLGERED